MMRIRLAYQQELLEEIEEQKKTIKLLILACSMFLIAWIICFIWALSIVDAKLIEENPPINIEYDVFYEDIDMERDSW